MECYIEELKPEDTTAANDSKLRLSGTGQFCRAFGELKTNTDAILSNLTVDGLLGIIDFKKSHRCVAEKVLRIGSVNKRLLFQEKVSVWWSITIVAYTQKDNQF